MRDSYFPFDSDVGITPTRKTHVIFNDARKQLVEPAWSMERLAPQLGRADTEHRYNNAFSLVNELYWQVSSYWESLDMLMERTAMAAFIGAKIDGAVSPAFSEEPIYTKPDNTLQHLILEGASALFQPGVFLFRKILQAWQSWKTPPITLYGGALDPSSGLKAFPGNFVKDQTLEKDQVFVSTLNDNKNRDLLFILELPSAPQDRTQVITVLSFNGPASAKFREPLGIGQYQLVLFGNGIAHLYEKLSAACPHLSDPYEIDPQDRTWALRMAFHWRSETEIVGGTYFIKVYKIGFDTPEYGVSGHISFRIGREESAKVTGKAFAVYSSKNDYTHSQSNEVVYTAPFTSVIPATQDMPVMVELRRDMVGGFAVYRSVRPEVSYFIDDVFTLPYFPMNVLLPNVNMRVRLEAKVPPGCAIESFLHIASSGDPCVELSSSDGGKVKTFQLPLGERSFYVIVKFTTDTISSPKLMATSLYKSSVYVENAATNEEYFATVGLNIIGPERTNQHESANIFIKDINEQATLLRRRGSIPVKVELETNADDPQERCVLFKGYTSRVTAKRRIRLGDYTQKSRNPNYTPAQFDTGQVWHEYEARAISMYQRLKEQVTFYNRRLWNPDENLPFKVTDIIRGLLASAGFDSDQLNIPDLPIRAYNAYGGPGQQLDILQDLGSTTFGFLDKYLGHVLMYDPNSGIDGQWILVTPPTAPYQNVAEFILDPSDLGSYAPSGNYLPTNFATYNNTTIPTTFIRKGSFHSWVKPPETNYLIVSAFHKTTTDKIPYYASQILVNFKSFDFGNGLVDPNHPDYLGRVVPMYLMVPELLAISLTLDENTGMYVNPALNWVARRVFDMAAHAIKTVVFEAPLLLVPEENSVTYKWRPLRYYDPVLINGQQFLIRNVNPTYTKDHLQWAVYECEAPRI